MGEAGGMLIEPPRRAVRVALAREEMLGLLHGIDEEIDKVSIFIYKPLRRKEHIYLALETLRL